MISLARSLQHKYRDAVQELCRQSEYALEARERLEQQVSRLLLDKQSTDSELVAAVDKKEGTIGQLEGKVEDMLRQLRAKDSIIANMQAECDQAADRSLSLKRRMAEDRQHLQSRIEDLELQLHADRERHGSERDDMGQRLLLLQQQCADLRRTMADLQDDHNQTLEEMGRLRSMLSVQESELRLRQQELLAHKQRAARLLHERDQTIERLRSDAGAAMSPDGQREAPAESASDTADDERGEAGDPYALHSRAALIGKVETLRMESEDLLQQLDMMKRQHDVERASFQLRLENMEKLLAQERLDGAKRSELVEELRLALAEESEARQRERISHQRVLGTKVQQIQCLQRELSEARSVRPATSEHAARIKSLTDHLVQKQAMLDTAESEKTVLRLQLSKEQDRVRELLLLSQLGPLGSEDLERGGGGGGGGVAAAAGGQRVRRVRHQRIFRSIDRNGLLYRALDKLDRLTLRSGTLLGRAPLLRILFFLYCIAMHVLLFFVMEYTTVNLTLVS